MSKTNAPDFFSKQVIKARRFYQDLTPSVTEQIAVVSGGYEHCTGEYKIKRDDFPYLSIEYVAFGKGSLKFDSNEYDLTAGTIFSYGPGIAHSIISDRKNKLVKYFIDFTGSRGRALMHSIPLPPGNLIQTSSINSITKIFEELIDNGQKATPFSKNICILLLEYLLLKITETAIPYGHANGQAYETYRHCLKHIEDNALSSKSLDQIAEQCHIDKTYLCRLFKRFDHMSPYQYIKKIKMEHAVRLLENSEISIKEISDKLQFSDVFHFSRSFKKFYGISPGKFAKSAR